MILLPLHLTHIIINIELYKLHNHIPVKRLVTYSDKAMRNNVTLLVIRKRVISPLPILGQLFWSRKFLLWGSIIKSWFI